MNSPEKVEVPEVQLSFVGGNSVVKPQATHFLPEDAEPHDAAEYYLTETLCLSRTRLTHVAESILKNSALKYLYLEGNQICSIPASLFISLSNLQWLDLRNNLIVSLPAEIGLHRCLKTLLLEGNPISELPPELGNVITLKGLNLRDCPLTFPPQDIVYEGLQNILQYLRTTMAKRPVSMTKTPPELPMVEKLQLSEMMGSSMEEQDESVDEDDMQRFKELKHKMILLDKAELGSVPQAENKSHVLPLTRNLLVRKKATPRDSIIPVLPLSNTVHWKKPEDRRQAAMKELKEKQAILEKRQKSQEALQKWHAQAKMTQEKKILGYKQKIERQRHQEEAETKPGVQNSSSTTQEQNVSMSISECVETRSARELERQIRARVEKMQERCRNPKGTTSEQMAAAEQDVEEMMKLQERLLERKRNWGKDLGNCFTIFTGDTWPSFLDK